MVCEHMLRESRPEVPLCFLALLADIVLQGGFYYVLGRILPAHTPDMAGQGSMSRDGRIANEVIAPGGGDASERAVTTDGRVVGTGRQITTVRVPPPFESPSSVRSCPPWSDGE